MGFRFVGNGAYCYANSAAMLLSSIGEEIPPGTLEVLSGVGLDVTWFPKDKSVLMGNIATAPDQGISSALDILGFEYDEKNADYHHALEELKAVVSKSPVAVGPLDAGLLSYNPFHAYLSGVDHFVFVYKVDDDWVHIHDPEGFPSVALSPAQFLETWKAERIVYRRGSYRYWASPKRKKTVGEADVFKAAMDRFQGLYRESEALCRKLGFPQGSEALKTFADNVASEALNEGQRARLVNFSFPVTTRRSLDYADFFKWNGSEELAMLKQEYAESFGRCQAYAMGSDWKSVSEELRRLASNEDSFRSTLLELS